MTLHQELVLPVQVYFQQALSKYFKRCSMLKYILIRTKFLPEVSWIYSSNCRKNGTFPAARSVLYYTCSRLPTNSWTNPSGTSCMAMYRKIMNLHKEDVAFWMSLPPPECLSMAATGSILQPACRRSVLGTGNISGNSSLGFTSGAFAVESCL